MAGISNALLGQTIASSLENFSKLKPLTTAITYASSCNRWLKDPRNSDSAWFDPFTTCQPGKSRPEYSPGQCPTGYYVAAIFETRVLPNKDDESNKQWNAKCCSSGFDLSWDGGVFACSSSFTTDFSVYLGDVRTFTVIIGSDETSTTGTSTDWDGTKNSTTLTTGTLFADPIEVWWRASDLRNFRPEYAAALESRLSIKVMATSTPSTVSLQVGASPSATAHIPGPTAAVSGDDSSSSSSLATGAKAGIALGSVFGVTAVVLAAFFFYRRSRRQREANKAVSQPLTASVEAPELVGYHNPGEGK